MSNDGGRGRIDDPGEEESVLRILQGLTTVTKEIQRHLGTLTELQSARGLSADILKKLARPEDELIRVANILRVAAPTLLDLPDSARIAALRDLAGEVAQRVKVPSAEFAKRVEPRDRDFVYWLSLEAETLLELLVREAEESAVDEASNQRPRTAELHLDTDDEVAIARVQEALDDLAVAVGLELQLDSEWRGSVHRGFFARIRSGFRSDEVQKRVQKLETQVEMMTVNKSRAELDTAYAQQVTALIDSLRASNANAVIRFFGMLFVAQCEGGTTKVLALVLTADQAEALDRYAGDIMDPRAVLDYLQLSQRTIQNADVETSELER
ncbi:hypothetical protein H0B43_37460 [Rhodococcus wratislaviensis]|nr:hypothetical protein [Rhodococcus sp. 4CII]